MHVDLWGWFWDEELRAHRQDDVTVKRIVELARRGWAYRRSASSELMLASFEEAATIARTHDNPCWELFCTYWACSTLFYHIDDLHGALERTIKLISRAHQPVFAHCPIRARIYFLLADIYYEIDVFGYEDKIRESLHFLENEIPMDADTHFRMQHRLADLAFLHEHYDDAFERVTAYMSEAQHNDFRMRSAHQLLRAIAYARGDIVTAHQHAIHAEYYAHQIQSHADIGISLLWQAALARRRGEETTAMQKALAGQFIFAQHDLPRWPDYYNALCDYFEMTGHTGRALEERQRQLADYSAYGSVFYLGWTYLQLCRLMGRMDEDLQPTLNDARALCEEMRKPAKYREKLEQIENGNYYEYPWQRDVSR